MHLAGEVEGQEAEARERERRVAAGERLEAVVDNELVGVGAHLEGAEAVDGVVDGAGTRQAAVDEVRTRAANHHLEVSKRGHKATYLDDLRHDAGHGPRQPEASHRVVDVPSIAGYGDGDEEEEAQRDKERDDGEEAERRC